MRTKLSKSNTVQMVGGHQFFPWHVSQKVFVFMADHLLLLLFSAKVENVDRWIVIPVGIYDLCTKGIVTIKSQTLPFWICSKKNDCRFLTKILQYLISSFQFFGWRALRVSENEVKCGKIPFWFLVCLND